MDAFFTGIFLLILGGGLSAATGLLSSFVTNDLKFPWENLWFVFSLVGFLIFPWSLTAIFVPVFEILPKIDGFLIVRAILFGFIFGVGNSIFFSVISVIGLSMAYSLNPSVVLIIGTIIPIFMKAHTVSLEVISPNIAVGLSLILIGLACACRAGLLKNATSGAMVVQTSEQHKNKFKISLVLCIISAIFAAQQNIGFILIEDIHNITKNYNFPKYAEAYLPWTLIMSGALMPSLGLSILKLNKNNTWHLFYSLDKTKLLRNLFFSALVGVVFFLSYLAYGFGATFLGDFGTSAGFSIFIASSILLSQLFGFLRGDWKESAGIEKLLIVSASICIIIGIFFMARVLN